MGTEADNLLIWAMVLHGTPATLREYQIRSREFLLGLQNLYADLTPLSAIGHSSPAKVPEDPRGIEHLIAASVFDQEHPNDYINLLADGSLGPNSLSRIGFSMTFCSSGANEQCIVPIEQGGARLRLQGTSAGSEPEASVVFEVPTNSRGALHEPRNLRRLLDHCLTKWQCNLGGIALKKYQQLVKDNAPASYAGQWLFYLPFPHLAQCLPADIRHEPFANGILIETTPHMPDANNPADVAAGKRVRDVLDELGLVNDATYAIEGWPPDREESLYERFISGAPPGRKYTVHCVNFDGYDPDRKVLLYAKLFRRLRRHPKEWGFRGWDGPVLNEAKRQVRAAAKAGGVPIEWHIGLEEPAHQVRQLLADYTNITEQQLRVIFTPLEEALSSPPP